MIAIFQQIVPDLRINIIDNNSIIIQYEGYPYLFGSDAHNLTDRKPNWDLLQKKVKTNVIDGAEVIL